MCGISREQVSTWFSIVIPLSWRGNASYMMRIAASKMACRSCGSLLYMTASWTSRCRDTLVETTPEGLEDGSPDSDSDSELDSESESSLESRYDSACVLPSSVSGVRITLLWPESLSDVLSSLSLLIRAAPWRSIIAHSILLAY